MPEPLGKRAPPEGRGALTGQELIQVLSDLPGHVPVKDSAAAVDLGDRIRIELELPRGTAFAKIIREVEREVAVAFLDEAGGNVSAARRTLGVSKDVWYRIRRSGEAKQGSKNWR